ncbi:TetR/AcrR family transcriptional regulator [uncultured Mycolicibacterium sp.]|uniref:TetR/AcrR family transcriptional regulator n=1 Tax=uncultured Mycolicibacterium sp. TaxID=2320817 RepID=UPI00261F853B|nr:TetR/AcrR family transcriptional regulator [uncultured Mycolicibacterium sp.]
MTANGDEATLWRREQRHLDDTQREVLRRHIAASQEVFADRIAAARPGLGVRKARLLALAVLVMYANTPEFRGTLSQDRLLQLQTAMARALIDCELPDPEPGVRPLPEPGRRRPAGRRERILDVAARLFNERGFHNVQMNDVARAAEISTATLYQHVNSKTDVLRAVLERGAQGLHYVTAEALACAATPRQALDALIESYIRQVLGVHGRVMSILTTDLLYLPEQVQAALRESQREYIAEWVAAIEALTEGLTAVDAGVLARAAIGVLTDLASLPVVRQRPGVIAELTAIARAMVLLPGPSDVADLAAAVASATR